MATVTTPAGEVLEGVTGQELAYYRGEGYEITDEESETVEYPIHFPPADESPDGGVLVPQNPDGTWGPATIDSGLPADPDAPQIVQLPDGQYVDVDGVVRDAGTHEPVADQPDPLDLH